MAVWRALCALALVGLTCLAPIGASRLHAAGADYNAVALTPLMGWSSWSYIRKQPTEARIEAQARALHESLQAHGYRYVDVDDFWYLNPRATVDRYGRWVVDRRRFPHGMAALARYVHRLGLKFGLYLTPGIPVAAVHYNTLIQGTPYHASMIADTTRYETNYNFGNKVMYAIDYGNPGAQAFVISWARQLASWGIDYLKLDGVGDHDIADIRAWSRALRQTRRPIYFDLSNTLDVRNARVWRTYANAWRIEGDIECYCGKNGSSYSLTSWRNVARRFADAPHWTRWAGPGGWNDLDSLEVGNGRNDGLTPAARQTAMTLWAIAAAPLSLGADLTHLDRYDRSLLTNDEVIAVDQDGAAGAPVSTSTWQQVWRAREPDGSYAVALFNLGGSRAAVTATWAGVGFRGPARVRDLWGHRDLGTWRSGFSALLDAHASRLLNVTPLLYPARHGRPAVARCPMPGSVT